MRSRPQKGREFHTVINAALAHGMKKVSIFILFRDIVMFLFLTFCFDGSSDAQRNKYKLDYF